MNVLMFTDDAYALHDTGPGHPERAERLGALIEGVMASSALVDVRRPAPAARGDLERVHDAHYVDLIERFCAAGGGELDPDTIAVPASWPAALSAAGSGLSAIDALRSGEGEVAVCVVRPPGHHAGRDRAMGFCLFNNAAVAAAALVEAGQRVAIVDWDVHHGNGTQDIFDQSPDVLFVSIHEWGPHPDAPAVPFFPGTGWLDEVGTGPGRGSTINIPFPAATGGDVYRHAMGDLVLPALAAFDPDWLLVSSGFDAHAADPLAHIGLTDGDYAALARSLAGLALPTVIFAEGGYDLDAIRVSMSATIDGFGGVESGAPSSTSPEAAWRLADLARDMAAASGALG